MKKLASLILALAMCLALAAPAFATSQTGNLTTELSSQLPELKLTLPEAATIILNPYRSEVDATVAGNSVGIDKGDRLQVMNPVFGVVSTTTNKVHVSAVVTGKVGGNAEFATATIAEGTGGHQVNLTLTYMLDSASSATAAFTPPAPDKVTNPTNVKTISDSEQTIEWDLPAATASGVGSAQRVNLQFGGTCSDSPSADDGPWKDSDSVAASFVFTASPVSDFPMIAMTYQPGGTVAAATYSDLVINTTQPTDYKDTPTITKIEYGAPGASTLTPLADTNSDTWGGSSWTGKVLTIKDSAIGAAVLTAAATNATKIVKVTVTYKDKSTPQVVQTVEYTAKVTVLAVPAS